MGRGQKGGKDERDCCRVLKEDGGSGSAGQVLPVRQLSRLPTSQWNQKLLAKEEIAAAPMRGCVNVDMRLVPD